MRTTSHVIVTAQKQGASGRLGRFAWFALSGSACLIGAVSLRYLLPRVPHPIDGSNFLLRKPWLATHAASASIALVAGPWQFLRTKDGRPPQWHRWNGWVYVASVVVGWVSSIPIAVHSQGGNVAHAGFLGLGMAWIFSTTVAVKVILKGDVPAHRLWMIRSYALTAAAITLRIMGPLSVAVGISFERSYPAIAWACWLVNLGLVEGYRLTFDRDRPSSHPGRSGSLLAEKVLQS